jgi:O-antigen ligase
MLMPSITIGDLAAGQRRERRPGSRVWRILLGGILALWLAISRFVKAYVAVVKLIESRELSLQRTETDTESRQMQQEIQAAALDLIQANGLTLPAYWELLGLANNDPEFRDRVLAQIDEAGR